MELWIAIVAIVPPTLSVLVTWAITKNKAQKTEVDQLRETHAAEAASLRKEMRDLDKRLAECETERRIIKKQLKEAGIS